MRANCTKALNQYGAYASRSPLAASKQAHSGRIFAESQRCPGLSRAPPDPNQPLIRTAWGGEEGRSGETGTQEGALLGNCEFILTLVGGSCL